MEVVKALINANDIDDVSLVHNVTTVAAIVFQQISRQFIDGRFRKNDVVIMFNCAFPRVKKSIGAYVGPVGGFIVKVFLLLFPLAVVVLLLLCCGCGGGGDGVVVLVVAVVGVGVGVVV
ncbi:hypothetical protein PIB30_062649 [Stylosanthes scabra]|uniref:Uncharacterized protein n=1 Tax=Stylosanthes scabra TaxID=79078 RepID=A0ABU6XJ70_9FABA|nr:hypothetical protein [Stylosanthes scabra]